MGLKLEKVIPWGRSFEEYVRMFNLTSSDCPLKILDCAAGPAAFNAIMTRQGNSVISCDPIYQFTPQAIAQRIQETYPVVVEGLKAAFEDYVWTEFNSPEQLGEVRMTAMQQFLEDFPLGLQQGRYQVGELPSLPLANQQFDLALCSHFLFSYSDHFSEEFHLQSILELCRVATEVRIFPLLKVSGEVAPLVSIVREKLQSQGYQTEIQTVNYEFQKSGNKMLRIY